MAIAFVVGLGLLLYPSIANYWNSLHRTEAIATYNDTVASLNLDTQNAMLEKARIYNQNIGNPQQACDLTDEERNLYNSTLDVTGTGIMCYIEIPAINETIPVYHGTSEGVLQVAAGHIEWTSLPTGGASTHTVISAHRGLPSARLFTDIDRLAIGDRFILHVLNQALVYEVDSIKTVRPVDVNDLRIKEGEDLCTLLTCTPYGLNTHRLLVRGHRVDNSSLEFDNAIVNDASPENPLVVALAIVILLAFVAGITGIVMAIVTRIQRLRERR